MFPLPPSPLTSPSRGIYLIRCLKSISLRDTCATIRATCGPRSQRGDGGRKTRGTGEAWISFGQIDQIGSWDNREKRAGAIVSPLSSPLSADDRCVRREFLDRVSPLIVLDDFIFQERARKGKVFLLVLPNFRRKLLKATENSSDTCCRRYLRNASFDVLSQVTNFSFPHN